MLAHDVRERQCVALRDDDPGAAAQQLVAWGNAVATTGRPQATASTSTPDVTWSSES